MIDTNKTGLVFGVFFSGIHIIWSALVLVGWAQPVVNFVFWAHMVNSSPVVMPFDIMAATTLVAITALLGYFVGCIVAIVWNKINQVI